MIATWLLTNRNCMPNCIGGGSARIPATSFPGSRETPGTRLESQVTKAYCKSLYGFEIRLKISSFSFEKLQ